MKPAVEQQFQVESNVSGTQVAMGIARGSEGFIMNMLSDMYANPNLAMIREYSTNAHDAHIEAGQTRPIEVSLPGMLAPFLKIRDFGVGLTVDGIHTIYSQYGASTKRDSNDQNGTFGIGCKAALAYCSQFTVTSVKDGTKIIVNVGRDDSGGGTMTIVDTLASDEANGTEVMIPVRRGDIDIIAQEAAGFYRFWEPGTVLVNGKQPQRFKGLRLNDNLYVMDDEPYSLVVMGNVAYPAPALDALIPSASVIAFVPIGDVNIPPSRESLMDTKTTRDTLERIKADFQKSVGGAIQREVEASATPQAAINIVTKWHRYLGSGRAQPSDFSYKGNKIPTTMHLAAYDPSKSNYLQSGTAEMLLSSVDDYSIGNARRAVGIAVHDWPTTVWVTDFAPEKYTASHKRKMLKWCTDQGLITNRFATGDQVVARFVMSRIDFPASPFIDSSRIVSWDVLKKIKLEVKPRSNGYGPARIPGSYDIYTEDGYKSGIPGDDLRQSYPIFYYKGNPCTALGINDAIQAHHPQYTIVCLALNRVTKFCRILPSAVEAKTAIAAKFTEWSKTVTDDQKVALMMRPTEREVLASMDAGKIDDPALQDVVRISKIDVAKINKALDVFRYYVDVGSLNVAWSNPLSAYPLFQYEGYNGNGSKILRRDPQHVYTYINAAYAAR